MEAHVRATRVLHMCLAEDFLVQTVHLAQCKSVSRRWHQDLPGVLYLDKQETQHEAIKREVVARCNLQRAAATLPTSDVAAVCDILAHSAPGLVQVMLQECSGLTDSAVARLAEGCRKLRHVVLTGCGGLTDAGVEALAETCSRLQFMRLAGCARLTDEAVTALARARGLQHLALNDCPGLTDEGLKVLAKREEDAGQSVQPLLSVDFRGCLGLTYRGAARVLAACSRLQGAAFDFDAQGLEVGTFLAEIRAPKESLSFTCPELLHQHLGAWPFFLKAAAGASLAQNCPKLQGLYLGGDPKDAQVLSLVDGRGRLERVALPGCTRLTDETAKALAVHCRGLRHVDLGSCTRLTDSAAEALGRWASDLRYVGLAGCRRLTGVGLAHLLRGECRELERVDLPIGKFQRRLPSRAASFHFGGDAPSELYARVCFQELLPAVPAPRHSYWGQPDKVTEGRIREVLEACPDLEAVVFYDCIGLTDEGVRSLAELCSGVRSVLIARCPRLTDRAALHLAQGCRSLRHLHCEHVPQFTEDAVRHLGQGGLELQTVTFFNCRRVPAGAGRHLVRGTFSCTSTPVPIVGRQPDTGV